MASKLKLLLPAAVGLLIVAIVVAYNNNAVAPNPSEVEPLAATGNVEDAAALLIQGAAAEDAILAESDSDLDILEEDSSGAADVAGAYDENAF